MRRILWLVALCGALAGCGATRSSPDNVMTVGGLTPSVKDPAGLTAVVPGLNMAKYRTVVVEKYIVSPSELEDDGDRRFAAKMIDYFHRKLLRYLVDSQVFQQVVEATATNPATTPSADDTVLRLRGTVTRLGRGDRASRAFGGLYGQGSARVQAETQLAEARSGRIVIATADRRLSSYNPWTFGGSDEGVIEECFEDLARDLVQFLGRLAKGKS